MIGVGGVVERVPGLDAGTLEVWVARQWVRPRREGGVVVFEEIDVARVRLIVELRDLVGVEEGGMGVVLSLLDQLHAVRAELGRVLGGG